jgi:hypothetical protein
VIPNGVCDQNCLDGTRLRSGQTKSALYRKIQIINKI